MKVLGWLVVRPGFTITNKPRGSAVRCYISEFMDAVWVRLPTPEFSRHSPLFATPAVDVPAFS